MKRTLIIFSVALIALIAIFGLVDPFSASPTTFLPIIGLVYVLFSTAFMLLIEFFFTSVEPKMRLFLGLTFGFTPTIIFALLTLSNLSPIDLLLAVCLPLVVAWYVTRVMRHS